MEIDSQEFLAWASNSVGPAAALRGRRVGGHFLQPHHLSEAKDIAEELCLLGRGENDGLLVKRRIIT